MAFGTETRGVTRSTAIHLQGLLLCLDPISPVRKVEAEDRGFLPMLIVVMESVTDRVPDSN